MLRVLVVSRLSASLVLVFAVLLGFPNAKESLPLWLVWPPEDCDPWAPCAARDPWVAWAPWEEAALRP